MDDIAAAAEVSRSTFFRYFPTKEDVVLFDDVDPIIIDAFMAQPPGTPLLTALRHTLRSAFDQLDQEKRELDELRMELARTVPQIAAALRDRNTFGIDRIAAIIAETFGLNPDDLDVQLFAGIIAGARLTAQAIVQRSPDLGYIQTLETLIARLEQGMPLAEFRLPTPATTNRQTRE